MMRHHLQNAWRTIRHHKLYTVINVLGLSIGICACMVIYLIARYDLGFDKFHPDSDRIYRIVGDVQLPDGNTLFLNTPFDKVAGVEHAIPGFQQQVGFHTLPPFGFTVPAGSGKPATDFDSRQEGGYGSSAILTGPSFFDLFPHPWLAGNPDVLKEPNMVVLTADAAQKYFGAFSPDKYIGRTLIFGDSLPLTVAGIVKDWTGLSDLGYTAFISISTAPNSWLKNQFPTTDWSSLRPHQSQAFVKLAPGIQPEQVNAALADFVRKVHANFFPGTTNLRLYLQPLSKMHYTPDFHPTDSGDDFRKGYLPLLYALIGVALFILVLAIINFVNLSTAQSLQRIKEVGIRKVMGSGRKRLVGQFLTETLLITSVAVFLSALFVRPAIALFHDYIPEGVHFSFDAGSLGFLLCILVFTTLAAGLYPALLLSAHLPVLSLKGVLTNTGTGGGRLRKALIVFQFATSLIFIIGSLVIGRQIHYMRNADKGFSTDAICTINAWRSKPEQMQLFAQKIRGVAGIKDVVLQGNAPMGFAHGGGSLIYRGKELKNMPIMFQPGDAAFIPFYGMKLLAGRNFRQGDSVREMVINETYSKALGFDNPADAVGQLLYRDSTVAYAVTGVVADFHQQSFHETIQPEAIWHFPRAEQSIGIKLAVQGQQGASAKAIVASIETEWKKVFPKTPFSFSFLNESISWLYGQETNTAFLMESAMVITILISCLGLFGLALFTANRREKEVSIRKVLGATVANVAVLLSRDFVLLVVIALAIASPVAWYFADAWLKDFAYRTSMNAWVLLEAGGAAVALALLTVGFLALRAACQSPAAVLRRE
jgi:putative ABC transport system permease protein